MAFTLHRLDATYTAPFSVPAMALVGDVPTLIKALYAAMNSRYSFIGPQSFRVTNSNTLSEVGIGINLLNGRLEILLRVDQLFAQATNLTNPEEVTFAQDCVLILHNFIEQYLSGAQSTDATLRISSWLNVEGGRETVTTNLHHIARPARNLFNITKIGAESVDYAAKIQLKNATAGWQITVIAEPSAVSEADLYLLRDYFFSLGGEMATPEARVAFVQTSTTTICEWLGIGTLGSG